MTMKLEEIKDEVIRLDPKIKRNDKAFKAAVVILSSAVNQLTTPEQVAKFTGYGKKTCETFLANLKINGLGWGRTKFRHSGWFSKNSGGVAFWLDTAVAIGWIEKSGNRFNQK